MKEALIRMIDLEEHQERISRLKELIYERIEAELDSWVVNRQIMSQIEKLAEDSVENFLASGGWFDPEKEDFEFDDDLIEENEDEIGVA